MRRRFNRKTRLNMMNTESEAKAILQLCDGNLQAALEMAERHLNTIYTRAQVLLSLAGMVVTVTGFNGFFTEFFKAVSVTS